MISKAFMRFIFLSVVVLLFVGVGQVEERLGIVGADLQRFFVGADLPVELAEHRLPHLDGDELEGLLVQRRGDLDAVFVDPAEGVHPADGLPRVPLQALLEQTGDGGLGAAHGAVQQDDGFSAP